jgi:hypothetical protein
MERFGLVSTRTAKKRSASSRAAARARANATPIPITAKEFDRKFEAGEDVSAHIDWKNATRPGRDTFKVNVDFPRDLLKRIDAEAARIGIARQSWIKLRIADVLDAEATKAATR